jgi:hypothetical protein
MGRELGLSGEGKSVEIIKSAENLLFNLLTLAQRGACIDLVTIQIDQ